MQDSRMRLAPEGTDAPGAREDIDAPEGDEPDPPAAAEADDADDDIEDFDANDTGDDEGEGGKTAEEMLQSINATLEGLVSDRSAGRIAKGGPTAQSEIDRLLADENTSPELRVVLQTLKNTSDRLERSEMQRQAAAEADAEKAFNAERREATKSYGLTKDERTKIDRYFMSLAKKNDPAAGTLTYEEAGVRVLGRARFSGQRSRGGASPNGSGTGRSPAQHITPGASPRGRAAEPEIKSDMTMEQVGAVFGSLYDKGR